MTHITGVAKLLNGVIYPLADIRFSRKTNKPLITSGSVTFPNTINIFSNSLGAVDFNLIPGEYQGIDFKTKVTFDFQVPDLVSVDWSSCLVEEAVVTPPIGYPAEYLTGTVQANQMPAFTGDVTSSAGSLELTIPDHSLANSKLAVMAASTLKGRVLGTTGDPQDLSASQVTGMLVEFSGTSKGLVPLSDDSGVKFLRGDGSWSIPEYSWEDLLTKPTTIDGYAITDAFAHSYVAKAGAYTVVIEDRGKIIETTGTWTLGLTAAATLGSGFSVIIANTSSGTITIDPASAELIDGAATFALGAGRMVLIVCTGSAWITLALAGSVTTSSLDTTAGRLVKTGDFGLGTAISLTASDNLNALVTSGLFYNPTGGNCAGNNYPITSAGALTVVARSATNVVQKFVSYGGSSTAAGVREFTRSYGTAGFGPWVELFHQGTVLGAVSQTAGVPTGRVIERGSNANGEYVRFADGTQICTVTAAAVDTTTAAGALFMHTNLLTWTFPAAFAAAPVVAGGGGNAARWLAPSGASVSSVSYRVYSYGSSGTLSTPSLTATGRWF